MLIYMLMAGDMPPLLRRDAMPYAIYNMLTLRCFAFITFYFLEQHYADTPLLPFRRHAYGHARLIRYAVARR